MAPRESKLSNEPDDVFKMIWASITEITRIKAFDESSKQEEITSLQVINEDPDENDLLSLITT